jgi:hypothetical protein
MVSQIEHSWLFIICFLFIVPIQSINAQSEFYQHPKSQISQSETTFEIANAQIYFQILSTGDYRCSFCLEIEGNNDTEAGLGRGEFTIPTLEIKNFSLRYSTSSPVITETKENESSIFKFDLSQIIPEGVRSTLTGDFSGTIWENMSDVYSYKLGINWGTTVGDQVTRIIFDGRQFALISTDPNADLTNTLGFSFLELTWNEVISHGFNCELKIKPLESSSTDLLVDLVIWNATVGQDIIVTIKNIGFFELEGFIEPSSWINANVSRFTLIPSQEISVLFSISDTISSGINGSIEIYYYSPKYYYYSPTPIVIPVYVVEGNQYQLFSEFLPLSIILIFVGSSVLIFHQREKIQPIFNEKINIFREKSNSINKDIPDPSEETQISGWKSIHSKWNLILPELEIKILEILYLQGSMNQQALADEIGVSKGTISRVISRLETKNFLFRVIINY